MIAMIYILHLDDLGFGDENYESAEQGLYIEPTMGSRMGSMALVSQRLATEARFDCPFLARTPPVATGPICAEKRWDVPWCPTW